MSSKVQQSVCSDCVTYAKSRIKFNTLNTFNNVEKDQIIYDKRKAMGESIRAMRTAQGWEQEQLAQIAGISISNIRSVEAGKYAVNIDVLNKIAGALGAELRMIEK